MWIILPVIAAYLTYRIHAFPKELGETVSKNVRNELDGQFDALNRIILEKVFESVLEDDDILHAFADNEDFLEGMRDLGEKVENELEMSMVS
jgi:hypothetical protein